MTVSTQLTSSTNCIVIPDMRARDRRSKRVIQKACLELTTARLHLRTLYCTQAFSTEGSSCSAQVRSARDADAVGIHRC